MSAWLSICCDIYNAALEGRKEAWRKQRIGLSLYQQQHELAELRSVDDDVAAVPSVVARSALRRLDFAFRSFLARCKRGDKPGYPRFRPVSGYTSFSVFETARLDSDRVILPRVGRVKVHLYRPVKGKIKSTTIVRSSSGQWFVLFQCDLGSAPQKTVVRTCTGVDMGLSHFATASDGTKIANPRFFAESENLLALRQRSLARCSWGSKTREKKKRLVSKAWEHVKNQRLDFARKVVVALFAKYDLIAYEDLNVGGRRGLGQGYLAKGVYDAAWISFLKALSCKAEWAGKWAVPVDPRGTSQRCSDCGTVVKKTLSERTHACQCGLTMDRDHNAALNILALGVSAAPKGLEIASRSAP